MKITAAEHLVPRTYEVLHTTRYTYDGPVGRCYERGLLAPRDCATQTVLSSRVTVSPEPTLIEEHTDAFGNRSHYIEIHASHTVLDVRQESVVAVAANAFDPTSLARWSVAEAAAAIRADARFVDDRLWNSLPTELTWAGVAVRDYASSLLAGTSGLGDALAAVISGIHRDFTYSPGATTVNTTLERLLELRAGVCQDFAHLALACLRSAGLPCRYVSGYIETIAPPGSPKLTGSDATHAWVSVLTPDGSWVDLDPTNDQMADSRYIVNAWGRDFVDVSPLKGVIYSEAGASKLDVGVTVSRVS